jgi:hypothetical protein
MWLAQWATCSSSGLIPTGPFVVLRGKNGQLYRRTNGPNWLPLRCVDYVVIFDEETPEECLRLLRPAIHCKGTDYGPPNGRPIPEAALVESYGGDREQFAELR